MKARRMVFHILPFVAAVLFYLFSAWALNLFWWQNLLASLVFYLGLRFIFRPDPKDNLKVALRTDNEELRSMFQEAEKDLAILQMVGQHDKDPVIRNHATHLFETGRNIFAYLKDHPEKVTASRQFFTYYLDTAAEILEKYQGVLNTGIQGPEIERARDQAKRALDILDVAFAKQFSRLVEGDLVDIDNELTVLEQSLKMEGDL